MTKKQPRKATKSAKRTARPSRASRGARARRPRSTEIRENDADLNLLLAYPAYGCVTCELIIERMEAGASGWDRRWENARRVIADWINACREADRTSFEQAEFDVWLGQEIGREMSNTMQVTIASRGRLPAWPLLELLRQRDETAVRYWDWGQQPIELGAFPELHVARGTVDHVWRLNSAFLALASERFKRRHELAPSVRDVYQQLAEGAQEPETFEWISLRRNSDEERPKNLYIFEVVKGSPFENGLKISQPKDAVSVGDIYDLADQLAWADVDIGDLDLEPYQRLHYVRYVRPALRAYCERFGTEIPDWLKDDAKYQQFTDEDRERLFGMRSFSIRTFKPARMPKGIGVVRRVPDENP
jgi:hypothetical protein